MTCLFDLDNYDCDGTTPDQCIEVLEKKFSSWLTPANDRERLPDCAAAIEGKNGPKHFRDRAAGIRTRFVDKKEGKQPEEKSPLFYKYLSDLNLNTWQSFLQKKGIQVNPFRLVLFLRDRWQEEINSIAGLNEDEAQARLQEVEKIMQWILDYYSSKKERLRHSMQKVANEISERQRAYKEKELKNKIEELRKNKKWRALADLLEEVDSHNHFGQFIDYLAEVGKETEDGYKWLIYRDRLVQFLAGVTANKSNHIGREFQQLEQDLYFLFSNLDRYGTLEDDRELNNKVNALFDDLLPMLREIRDPEERYRELVQLENQFEGILPSPTAQWETFKVTMREELTKLFDDRLKDLLAHTKDLDDIRVQVDALEEKAAGIGIEGLYTPIENVKTQLVNLTNFVEAQELYLAKDNPMNIRHYQAQLQELEENYRGIEEFVSGWAVCKHLKNTFNENSKIFRQTANINDEIDELVLEVGKESQKILHNDLSVDISQFAGKFDQIKKKVHSISKTKGKTIFLENLATLIADIKRILLEPNGKETLSPDRHPYIQPILELVRAGEVFRNAFEELLVENPDDPVQTIDQFLQIIAQYKGTPLLLVAGEDKQLVALVEQIMKTIEQRITAVLEPITRALEPFIPLVPEEKLKQFETRLTAIRTRIPGSEDDYSGYEEISLPFEQKLDELTDMVHIQRLLSRQKFAEVRKYIRRDNYSSPAFKRRMNACAYYYEYLHEKEWADDIWLKFFEQFGHQVADFQQGKRTDGIPFKYQELLEKNLPEIEPVKLQQHHNAVKKYLPFSHLAPYLEFLYGDDMPEQLIRKIQNKKRAQKVFSLFLQYMETYHMWTRYAGLFAACDDKLKSCFSKPLFDKVHSHLAQQYQALKENFIETGTISIEALDTFYNLIPGDEAFRSHLECYEELESLRHHATQLATILSKSRQKDIWVDDQFKASLRDLLGSCNHFAGDFAVIRTNNRWESIIANLEYVYNTGGKLIAILTVGKDEENSDGIDFIKTHKSKAAIDYSTKLQQSLNNLLEQWQRFCEQVDQLPDEYDTLLTLFNDFHYKYILENWQKLKLFALWRKQELAEPGNVMEFFDMLKHILDNHRQFLEETADGTKEIEPVTMKEKNIKVLDPFIDSRTRKNRSEKMAD